MRQRLSSFLFSSYLHTGSLLSTKYEANSRKITYWCTKVHGPLTDRSTPSRNMAVRAFEGKAHAAAYLQYRVAPKELTSRIVSYMKEKETLVRVFHGPAGHSVPLSSPELTFFMHEEEMSHINLKEGRRHQTQTQQLILSQRKFLRCDSVAFQTPNQFSLAVDVGCGSGQGTIPLASHFTKVVGTDVSPAQLEMALTNENPPNVSYKECQAEKLPFASGEVDLVAAMTAAHWFDRKKFLVEADRVLRPGGCLALLSYTLDMELEYGDISSILNDICEELHAALNHFRHPYLEAHSRKIYSDMFDSCSYPDKEWNKCLRVKRILPLSGYIGMVGTFATFQILAQKDPEEAERLLNVARNKLMSAMKVSSLDTEVTVVVKYFYWLARKPV